MKVRITAIIELESGSSFSDEEERESLVASLTDADEPSYIHSNYIGDTIGQIISIEHIEEVTSADKNNN